ncbi:MAG: hypothetical protein WAK03_16925 [Methylocystis sp.]
MRPDLIQHLRHNWPLALIAAGLALYIPAVLASGAFYTNQGWIARSREPARYWRWVFRFVLLLAACVAVLWGSYLLDRAT